MRFILLICNKVNVYINNYCIKVKSICIIIHYKKLLSRIVLQKNNKSVKL